MSVLTRFAPSPTGFIHIGNCRTALFCWAFAKANQGKFLLRFDDTDVTRSTEEFAEAIHKDLAWLGLHHDTTAKQSDRLSKYEEAFQSLIDKDMVYACYEAPDELDRKRKRQLSRGLPPVYDRAALNLSSEDKEKFEQEGRAAHWRFKLSGKKVIWNDMIRGEQSVDTASLSDPVVRRHDGSFLYSLPSVVDDIEFGITHVIRGEDHVTNTATHIEMIEALGGKVPCLAHHPLLVMSDGSALSKRLGSLSVGSLRDQGLEAMSVNSLLARLGTPFPIEPRQTLEELVDVFDLSRLGRAPARFDEQELKRLNMKLLHDMPYALVAERLQAENIENAEDFWTTIRGNIELLSDIEVFGNVIAGEIGAVELSVDDKSYIQAALLALPSVPFDDTTWLSWTNHLKMETGRKGKDLFMPLRQALTGKTHGPEMNKLLVLIGAERTKERLMAQINKG